MKIYICQLNPIIGDIKGNKDKIIRKIEEAKAEGANLAIFPELALTGYPPQDLLLRPHFIKKVWEAAEEIEAHTEGLHVLVGLPRKNQSRSGKPLFNSCAIFSDRFLLDFYDKMLLPTYDVFDERRYFEPGYHPYVIGIGGKKVALTICEDIWDELYAHSPITDLKQQHVDLLINISASPYYVGKHDLRKKMAQKAAKALHCPVLLVNQVGGNDTLIFDGHSFIMSPSGNLLVEMPLFEEACTLIDLDHLRSQTVPHLPMEEELLQALTLGLRDFCHKQGFQKTVLGLSGGIDSALVAAIAERALGKENVLGVLLPSRYSSPSSLTDAKELAEQLGIRTVTLPIEPAHAAMLEMLKESFKGCGEDVTEENIQSRIRGTLLMALANKYNALLLNTGNKSEYAVGYCTMYGDMCGALSVIGDLTKKEVYALSKYMKLPEAIIQKEPSAELKPNQKDADYLPIYSILDQIVSSYIEDDLSPSEIAAKLHLTLDYVLEWCDKIDRADFKRMQAPPILKVTRKSLSFGRHFPIVKHIQT